MRVEVSAEKDGKVVVSIFPLEEGEPKVFLKETPDPEPQVQEDVKGEVGEEVPFFSPLEEDPAAFEEFAEAQKKKGERPPTEKQLRYFHFLARKAGIKDTHQWMVKNGFPPSSKECSQAELSKAIDLLKDLDWAKSLEPPDWRKRVEQEELL